MAQEPAAPLSFLEQLEAHWPGVSSDVAHEATGACLLLRRLGDFLSKRADQQLAHWGLTGPRYDVLRLLQRVESGSLTWLSHGTLSGNANITRLVDGLEQSGLVERVFDSKDRRVVNVRLTEKGRELHDAAFLHHRLFIAELMAGLDSDEIRQLIGLLDRLGTHAQQIGTPEPQLPVAVGDDGRRDEAK